MRVLLVAPRVALGNRYLFPLGLGYLAAALKQAGCEVHCRNQAFDDDPDAALARTIQELQPDVVGAGGLTPSFPQLCQVVNIARRERPSACIMVGGGAISSDAAVAFPATGADVAVLGEGEATAVELLAALQAGRKLEDVPGLMLKTEQGCLTTPARPLIADLDTIPYPDYHGFGLGQCLEHVNGTIDIIASRGCPFNCTFCYSALGRRRHRLRSLDNLFGEIDLLVNEFPVSLLGVMDELFSANPARIQEFCERIVSYPLSWYTQVRVDSVNKATLRTMARANCRTIFYGFESMDATVLGSMRKKIGPEAIEHAAAMSYDVQMGVFANFIFGDPAETQHTARNTLRWWYGNRRHLINMGFITCWPGTKIYHDSISRGLIEDPLRFMQEGCPRINMTNMPDAVFHQLVQFVETTHEAMLFPGKILHLTEDDCGVHVTSICPHCQAVVSHAGIGEKDIPDNRSSVRTGCPECARQFDLPLPVPRRSQPQAARQALAHACELLHHANADAHEAAVLTLRQLVGTYADYGDAWDLLGRLRLQRGEWAHAWYALSRALFFAPWKPWLCEAFASLLLHEGWEEFAPAWTAQAVILREAVPAHLFAQWSQDLPEIPSPSETMPLEQALTLAGFSYTPGTHG